MSEITTPFKEVKVKSFSVKDLVTHAKDVLQISSQIKSAGYNPYLGNLQQKAKEKLQKQINLYEPELKQLNLKIKS
jgi:hypothetical protein